MIISSSSERDTQPVDFIRKFKTATPTMKLSLLFFIVFFLVVSVLGQRGGGGGGTDPQAAKDFVDSIIADINKVINFIRKGTARSIVVQNKSSNPFTLSCASKNDKIRVKGSPNPTVKKGQALGWSFHKTLKTQFWCTVVYKNGKKCGGDVYYAGWKDAPKDVYWTIYDNCVVTDFNDRKRPDIFKKQ